MDLTQLLASSGGEEGPADLGRTLGERAPSGDLLFEKPFGARTAWKTSRNGKIAVTAIFDPYQLWEERNLLASTTPNYVSTVRRRLGERLCPEAMAPEELTMEETILGRMRALLPSEAFKLLCLGKADVKEDSDEDEDDDNDGDGDGDDSEKLQEEAQGSSANKRKKQTEASKTSKAGAVDKSARSRESYPETMIDKGFLRRYARMLERNAVDQYREEVALLDALNNRDFSFTFHLAIDSYPTQESSHSKSKQAMQRSDSLTGLSVETGKANRTGVLMFHFQGVPPTDEAKSKEEDDNDKPARLQARHTNSKSDEEALTQVLGKLSLDPKQVDEGSHAFVKRVPPSADDFFSEFGTWFEAVLDSKKQALMESNDSRGHMYR